MSKKLKSKKLTKKDLRVITGILIAIFAIIVVAWSIINPSSSRATDNKTLVLFGWDTNKFKATYPNADFAPLWKTATQYGVSFYGIDAFLGPLVTGGGGLDFAQCDLRIPQYLSWLPDGMPMVLPVSSYNWGRLSTIYNYFVAKGWIDIDGNSLTGNNRKWIVFDADRADEVRAKNKVTLNNNAYTAFKALYPTLLWMVTDSPLPIAVGDTSVVLADVFLPQSHNERIEYHKYNTYPPMQPQGPSTYAAAYNGKIKGMYVGGSFPGNNDPTSMVPGYYVNAMKQLGFNPAPFVPTPLDHPEEILAYTHTATVKAKIYSHWAGWQWLIPTPGNPSVPKFRQELYDLMSGRSQGY